MLGRFCPVWRSVLRGKDGRFRNDRKGLAERRGELALLPNRVRKYEIKQAPFLSRLLFFESVMGLAGNFE